MDALCGGGDASRCRPLGPSRDRGKAGVQGSECQKGVRQGDGTGAIHFRALAGLHGRKGSLRGFTDLDLADLAMEFGDPVYPTITEAFGSESDLDGNGRVIILFTPAVNRPHAHRL